MIRRDRGLARRGAGEVTPRPPECPARRPGELVLPTGHHRGQSLLGALARDGLRVLLPWAGFLAVGVLVNEWLAGGMALLWIGWRKYTARRRAPSTSRELTRVEHAPVRRTR